MLAAPRAHSARLDEDNAENQMGIDPNADDVQSSDPHDLDDFDMVPAEGRDAAAAETNDCLDPFDLDNSVPSGSVESYPEIGTSVFSDVPDPGSQADPEVESRPPSPDPLHDNRPPSPDPRHDNFSSGPDIEELLETVALKDLELQLQFIKQIHDASLQDKGMEMDEEDLERLRNPLQHEVSLDEAPDVRLSLDLFLANVNSPVEVYNANRTAILRRHPDDSILTHDSAKRVVRSVTGVIPLTHDMCIDTCVAYTGPYRDLERCPHCDAPRYYQTVLEDSGGTKKVARRQFHTMPVGPQLQALYRSHESAERMRYGEEKLKEIINAGPMNRSDYEDWCHGTDFIHAFLDGRINKGDPVLMFSIDGAQLYRSKSSDCWIYIWVVFSLDPAACRYKKTSVLFGGVIPGPNKPKHLESFLFPGLHHLSAIQNEGLVIWDASADKRYISHPFLALATADGPAMAYINGLVGHQGKIGCRLYCPFPGRRKGSHYYPVCLKPENDDIPDNNHDDLHPDQYASKTFANYKESLELLSSSRTQTEYKQRRLITGIVKPGIFLGLQEKYIMDIPRCFGYDIMHLVSLNLTDLLISLWRGTIAGDKEDRLLWDWAVLKDDVWVQHGQDVASMRPYLPGSFDRPPRNPVEKINSGYKAWEFLLYVYALGPGLFYNVLPKKYWQNLCLLVSGVRKIHQFKIAPDQLRQAHFSLLTWVLEFETLYYQRRANRLHFVRPCVHILIHMAPEVHRAGPALVASQWTMERAIGDLGGEIRQPSNPYANLSERASLRCQINALRSILPELAKPVNTLPHGAKDLGGGYVLLRAREDRPSLMTESASIALERYYEHIGQPLPRSKLRYQAIRWARLRLPTGQIARSSWKEKQKDLSKLRTSRNVKVSLSLFIFPLEAECE